MSERGGGDESSNLVNVPVVSYKSPSNITKRLIAIDIYREPVYVRAGREASGTGFFTFFIS